LIRLLSAAESASSSSNSNSNSSSSQPTSAVEMPQQAESIAAAHLLTTTHHCMQVRRLTLTNTCWNCSANFSEKWPQPDGKAERSASIAKRTVTSVSRTVEPIGDH
jgi:hypothetical protein